MRERRFALAEHEERAADAQLDDLDPELREAIRRHSYACGRSVFDADDALDRLVADVIDPRPAPGKVPRALRGCAPRRVERRPDAPVPVVLRRPAHGQVETDDDGALRASLRRQGGAALPDEVRAELEDRLGGDLRGVRIHTDPAADAACLAACAEAFTVGDHVFFASGAYDPSSPRGFELLAHELTHVVQYYQGRTRRDANLSISRPSDPLEREADEVAARVTRTRRQRAGSDARVDRPRFRPTSGPASTVARKPAAKGVVTLKLLGATYEIPVRRGAGSVTRLNVPLRWRIGGLRLWRAELVLDSDFEIQSGTLTGGVRLGRGLRLDGVAVRYKGGKFSPTIESGQLRLGRHGTIGVKNLTLREDGAVSGAFKGTLSKKRTLAGGAIVLKPGFWLSGTFHHNKLTGVDGGGATVRVDKLDIDFSLPTFTFDKGDGKGWNWNWNVWKYLRFPKLELPRFEIGRKKGGAKVRFAFENPDAGFADSVLTITGKPTMWMGKRSVGIGVVVKVSRGGVSVQVGPQIALPSITIPLIDAHSFRRPKNGKLYPIIPKRKFAGKKKANGALEVSVGASFGLHSRKTSLEAFVKLTRPRLRGGVKLPGVELHARKVPSKDEMFGADFRVRANVGASAISLPLGLGSLGLGAKGYAAAKLDVIPTLEAHLSTAEGVFSGGVEGRLRFLSKIKAALGVNLKVNLFGMSHKQPIWNGGLRLQLPVPWSPSFKFDFGKLGPDDVGARSLVSNEQFNSLAKDFDSHHNKQASGPKTSAATTHLDRVQRMVELVLTGVEILTPLHKAIGKLKNGNFLGALRAAAKSPEELFDACMEFHALCEQSQDDQTFEWMEEFLPMGREFVSFLRWYLSIVNTGAETIGAIAGVLGYEDHFATARKIKREHKADNEAAIKATRIERELLSIGSDPISARRVMYLTWKRYSPTAGNYYVSMEDFEIAREVRAKGPRSWSVRNAKREELVGQGIPRDVAHEIACLYRLAYVNSTGDSWQYVQEAKKWETSAKRLSMGMMMPTGDRRYFDKLVRDWVDRHRPKRLKIEKGIK